MDEIEKYDIKALGSGNYMIFDDAAQIDGYAVLRDDEAVSKEDGEALKAKL